MASQHCTENFATSCHLNLSSPFICSFIHNNSDLCEGGGYIPYTEVVFCAREGTLVWPLLAAFLVLLVQYFLALSIAADSFFCPSLAVIVDHLKISQNIAGVTFLAFGNGAPDIFAAIASVLSTKTPKFGLALGALLGAGMFLSTVIVAIVTLLKPFDIMRRPAIRDLGFFLVTVLYVFFILYYQRINLLESAMFIGFYLLYACVVVVGRYIRLRLMPSTSSADIITADLEEEDEDLEYYNNEAEPSSFPEITDDPLNDDQGPYETAVVKVSSPPRSQRKMQRVDSVIEEANWRYDVFHSGAISNATPSTPQIASSAIDSDKNRLCGYGQKVELLWFHLWKGIRPFTKDKWTNSSWFFRGFLLVQSPVIIILSLTIPVVNLDSEDSWSQPLTILQCILASLFVLFAMRDTNYMISGTFPLWILVLLVGSIFAYMVFLSSDLDRAPKYFKLLAYGGFIMSVLWIYSLATEVVGIITMIGAISGAPEEILGLTLLAWSNSLGDLISDISVARQGYPRMAISACFGGPLFNLLLGIGIPFTIASFRAPGHFFPVCFSSITLILVGFLTWSLISSFILLPVSRFHATRPYAAYLLVVYASFLLIASLTASGAIPEIPVPHA